MAPLKLSSKKRGIAQGRPLHRWLLRQEPAVSQTKGMGEHRCAANSGSGRRRLRRLEESCDGTWSADAWQRYILLYRAIQYLSLAILK